MLLEKLQAYEKSDIYPFHMPGHKRRMTLPADAYGLDLTEVDGFDNLHHAQGILAWEQKRLADFVGARESFFLVNGSTCGILAAISASVRDGGRILFARNSHKSAYHALMLRRLSAVYVYPQIGRSDIQDALLPEDVKRLLSEDDSIEAVYITSPTYDGVVSDVKSIAQIVHAHEKILIVDEAHGAHFGFHPFFPESAVKLGADVVIQSMHKTLPAFTQSAALHRCSDRVDEARLKRFLDVFESSSPSYVLMAGLGRVVPFLENEGQQRFDSLAENLKHFYERSRALRFLYVLQPEDFAGEKDASKILVSTRNCDISGKELYECLLRDYHLQLEMYSGEYVTALCTLMDGEEGFARLLEALFSIDKTLHGNGKEPDDFIAHIYSRKKQILSVSDAMERQISMIKTDCAKGQVSGEFVYLYPPGIPMIVPGEEIDAELVQDMKELKRRGLVPEGMRDASVASIGILRDYNCNDRNNHVY